MSLDQTIQQMFPTVLAPREGELEEPCNFGTRYVAASGGLWRQVALPWMTMLHLIAPSVVALPYGDAKPYVKLKCGPIPNVLRRKFCRDALAALPNESAAAFIWNAETGEWRYCLRPAFRASAGYIEYLEVVLGPEEYLILDMHSHGTFPAFFSSLDNSDDRGTMRFSGVIGSLDSEEMTSVVRLNMLGMCWEASVAPDGTLEVTLCN